MRDYWQKYQPLRRKNYRAGLATEKRRVDALNTQLNAVRAAATEATRIGTDVRQRADAAANGAAVDARLTSALANRLKRAPVQEFTALFDTGQAELSGPARQALLGAVKLLVDNPTYTADVVGYTDDVGATGSNVTLGWRREEVVKRFIGTSA
ncbi:MAG: hypothetical protein ACREMO_11495 [Gemmatimonadales bacterium]